jgi:hypothetical protein
VGSNAESSANPGLFFFFGDDDEEMYAISSTMDVNEKLGKATGMEKNKQIKDIGHSILFTYFLILFSSRSSESSDEQHGLAIY